jgi:AraC family transcriptional activator of pobA
VHQPFALHLCANAGFTQQLRSAPFERPAADTALHMGAGCFSSTIPSPVIWTKECGVAASARMDEACGKLYFSVMRPGPPLRRACYAAAGQWPIDLIHLRILVEAERRLRYTSMSVTQIVYYPGFEDPAYFGRFFARRAKISPRAFRTRDH